MAKRILNSAVIYNLIAVLFALSAVFKTVSEDARVVNLLWLAAILFALIGLWRKRSSRAVEAEDEKDDPSGTSL